GRAGGPRWGRVPPGPGPRRRAARRYLGGEGGRLGGAPAVEPGRPPTRSRCVALPAAGAGRAAVPLSTRERWPHPADRRPRARRVSCARDPPPPPPPPP